MKSIICDNCIKDITETGKRPAYRLTLSCEPRPHNTNSVYAVMVYPPINQDHHFCDLDCLANWLKTRLEKYHANS